MKHIFPAPAVSLRWQNAASTTAYKGDLPALRTFVQSEAKSVGSRLVVIKSRAGLLQDPHTALCAAVWLLLAYHQTSVRYRLLEKQRVELYKVLRGLAEEVGTSDAQYLVTRLSEGVPESRRHIMLGSIRPPKPSPTATTPAAPTT